MLSALDVMVKIVEADDLKALADIAGQIAERARREKDVALEMLAENMREKLMQMSLRKLEEVIQMRPETAVRLTAETRTAGSA